MRVRSDDHAACLRRPLQRVGGAPSQEDRRRPASPTFVSSRRLAPQQVDVDELGDPSDGEEDEERHRHPAEQPARPRRRAAG